MQKNILFSFLLFGLSNLQAQEIITHYGPVDRSSQWKAGASCFAWGAVSTAAYLGIAAGGLFIAQKPNEPRAMQVISGSFSAYAAYKIIDSLRKNKKKVKVTAYVADIYDNRNPEIQNLRAREKESEKKIDNLTLELQNNATAQQSDALAKESDALVKEINQEACTLFSVKQKLKEQKSTENSLWDTYVHAKIASAQLEEVISLTKESRKKAMGYVVLTESAKENGEQEALYEASSLPKWQAWGFLGGIASALTGIISVCYKTGWLSSWISLTSE